MAEEGRGEGFLSRWSRLKRGAPAGPEAPQDPVRDPALDVTPPTAAPADAVPAPGQEPEPEIDLASLPPVEEITAGTDISGFLRKGVPALLRNAALRRAWSADPLIRDFVGPADYAWDWNVPGGAPGYVAEIASGPDVDALADRILGLVKRETAPDTVVETGPKTGPKTGPETGPEAGPAAEMQPEQEPRQEPAREGEPADAAPASIAAPPQPPPTPAARPRHGGAVPA